MVVTTLDSAVKAEITAPGWFFIAEEADVMAAICEREGFQYVPLSNHHAEGMVQQQQVEKVHQIHWIVQFTTQFDSVV